LKLKPFYVHGFEKTENISALKEYTMADKEMSLVLDTFMDTSYIESENDRVLGVVHPKKCSLLMSGKKAFLYCFKNMDTLEHGSVGLKGISPKEDNLNMTDAIENSTNKGLKRRVGVF
jgi:hypothetical protein